MYDETKTSSTMMKGVKQGFNTTSSAVLSEDLLAKYDYKDAERPVLVEGTYYVLDGSDRHFIPEQDHTLIDEQIQSGKVAVERPFVMNFSDPELEQKIELNALVDNVMDKIKSGTYERAALAKELTEDTSSKLSGQFNSSKSLTRDLDNTNDHTPTRDLL